MASSSFDDDIESTNDPNFLVRLLLEEGEVLSARLRAKILSTGSAAISPLINMLNNEALQMEKAPGGGSAPIHAVDLLAELKAEAAIEPMLRWLAETEPSEDILHAKIITALGALGKAAYQPILDAFEKEEKKDLRKSLCDALICTGIRNDRIFNIILELFEEEKDYGATCFALYGDPKALGDLHRALAACEYRDESHTLFANQTILDLMQAIIELGGQLTRAEAEKLNKVNSQRAKNAKKIDALLNQVEEKPDPIRQKPGRNDLCWCGSGKKYKHCHWQIDRTMN
ncbi:MAG: SEC-C metal-binding domain-containing protein [bacterium]|nr:SEC-C metal-binding domain-containing protein [bacterium]